VVSFLKLKASYAESKDGGTTALFTPNLSNIPAANNYGFDWTSPYGGPTYQFSPTYTLAPTYSSQTSAQYSDQTISPKIYTADRKATEFGIDLRFLANKIVLMLPVIITKIRELHIKVHLPHPAILLMKQTGIYTQ